MQEINNEDEILTKFAGEINKAYARDQMLKRKLEEYQETFEGCIWHNDEAIRALLGEYRRSLNEIGYSTEVLVLAFKELAKVYKAKADITQTGYELTVRKKEIRADESSIFLVFDRFFLLEFFWL